VSDSVEEPSEKRRDEGGGGPEGGGGSAPKLSLTPGGIIDELESGDRMGGGGPEFKSGGGGGPDGGGGSKPLLSGGINDGMVPVNFGLSLMGVNDRAGDGGIGLIRCLIGEIVGKS